ncbi:L-asparaginase 1 [Stieleria neptunia]|uniref:L-asparaginase 1 n=1 Tax=Stieleria neptunia TaxID=2527979 RepID=A0A518HIJ3_9BACT|nr:asparaginase [Stieleria neptunia]QDV40676.1 L-asparaginase 1 [Stieleria neptunia]
MNTKTNFHQCTTHDAPGGIAKARVLVIYTGGTIGAVPKDAGDPHSPLVIASWERLSEAIPKLDQLRERGIKIDAHAFVDPIDSTNIRLECWTALVDLIAENIEEYDGFVVVHGTDTMVYTASALSFMLKGLPKPVILTGAQVPVIGRVVEDGTRNLLASICLATKDIPEVCIFFDKRLYRGNRTIKSNASGLGGFSSPNYPPLAEIRDSDWSEDSIWINKNAVVKTPTRAFLPQTKLDATVVPIRLFPGISGDLLKNILHLQGLDGAVLEAYGTGNAPTDPDFLDPIGELEDKIAILDVSQCEEGEVRLGQYETGAGLLSRGVLSGADITAEAALCKLLVVLSDKNVKREEAKRMIEQNLAGEQSQSVLRIRLEKTTDAAQDRLDLLSAPNQPRHWDTRKISHVTLTLFGISTNADDASEVGSQIELHVNLEAGRSPKQNSSSYAGTFMKNIMQSPAFASFDLTDVASSVAPGAPPRVSLFAADIHTIKVEKALLMLFLRDASE